MRRRFVYLQSSNSASGTNRLLNFLGTADFGRFAICARCGVPYKRNNKHVRLIWNIMIENEYLENIMKISVRDNEK